jgi:hypothetical protein
VVSVVVVELWVSLVWVPLFIVLVVVAVEVVAGLSMFLHIGGLCECCQDLGREISDAKKQSILAGQMLATLAKATM